MKVLIFLLVICSLCSKCFSAVAISAPPTNFSGVCVLDGEEYEPGNYKLGNCILFVCNEDGSTQHKSCVSWGEEGCTKGAYVDVTRPFPKCCQAYYHCKDKYGISYTKKAPPEAILG